VQHARRVRCVDLGDLMLDTLTAKSFSPHIGEVFEAETAGHRDSFTLVQVMPGMHTAPEGMRAPFTLIFQGAREDVRFDHMTRLSHPALGTLELAIAPVARLKDGRFEYQAGFN
jgi:hypothetical protein